MFLQIEAKSLSGIVKPGLHRAPRYLQNLGDLGHSQFFFISQREDRSVAAGQSRHGFIEVGWALVGAASLVFEAMRLFGVGLVGPAPADSVGDIQSWHLLLVIR